MVLGALMRIRGEPHSGDPRRPAAEAARYRYLDTLADTVQGLPVSRVAQMIGVDLPRASRLTTELIGADLIRRVGSPMDTRVSLVLLTPAGRSLVEQRLADRQDRVDTALAGLSDEQVATLADLLGRFVEAWARPLL